MTARMSDMWTHLLSHGDGTTGLNKIIRYNDLDGWSIIQNLERSHSLLDHALYDPECAWGTSKISKKQACLRTVSCHVGLFLYSIVSHPVSSPKQGAGEKSFTFVLEGDGVNVYMNMTFTIEDISTILDPDHLYSYLIDSVFDLNVELLILIHAPRFQKF